MATLKQSTAYTRMFLMVQSADHVTGLTGATVTVTLSKAGGAFGAAGGTVTEVSSGWYKIALTTTDTNTLGDLAFHCTAASGDPTDFVDQVSARIADDLAYPATSGRSMVVDAAGLVDANMVKMGPTGSGTAQTARDIGASVLLSNGTGTGQVKLASGYVAMTWADIAAPTTAVNLSGTTISTSQAVASVSGAVGSVTGNVGGNVTGSVGSVLGNVGGSIAGSVDTVVGDIGGSVLGTIGGLTAAALAQFATTDAGTTESSIVGRSVIDTLLRGSFLYDTGTTYASSVTGSVVKETADNAGGSALTVQDIVDGVFNEAVGAHTGYLVTGVNVGSGSAAFWAQTFTTNTTKGHADIATGSVMRGLLRGMVAYDTSFTQSNISGGSVVELTGGYVVDQQGTIPSVLDICTAIVTLDLGFPSAAIGQTSVVGLMLDGMIDYDTGLTYADAVSGSVVYETATNATVAGLTFTVAGQVDANIRYVNNTAIDGVGTSGNPWGPA